MNAPNPRAAIFVPGKIIQVRNKCNPLLVTKLAFISVEEHIRHVAEMHEWLYPHASPMQRAAVVLHDVGKKVGARGEFLSGLKISQGTLRADFYGDTLPTGDCLPPDEAGHRYLNFASTDRHRRLWPARSDAGELQDVRMDLDPPFGYHAADVTEEDLAPYSNGELNLASSEVARRYVLDLVQLHHSFQPDRIVSACARHGEQLVTDLYRLIVADHMGSRWAEYVVQQIEDGFEKPDGEDFFGDVKVTAVGNAFVHQGDHGLRAAIVELRRADLPNGGGGASDWRLLVRYSVIETNWDLRQLLGDVLKTTRRRSSDVPTRKVGKGRRP